MKAASVLILAARVFTVRFLRVRARFVPPVAAMAAMAVKQMHERTGEHEKKRQILEDVRAVLGNQEIGANEDESQEHPASCAAARAAISMRMVSHAVSLISP